GDAAEYVHLRQHGVEHLAADVLEVDVDALRTGLAKLPGEVAGLVVDAGVEPQLVGDVAALFGSAGDSDRAAALDLGDLSDHRADGSGCRRDDHRLAGLGLADLEQAEVGSQARHAEPADPAREGGEAGVDLDDALAVGDGIFLHAEQAAHRIAGLERRVVRLLDEAGGIGAHHLAQPYRRNVGATLVHPAAHGRVERDHLDPDAELAGARLRHGAVLEGEVLARHHAPGPAGEPDHAVAHCHLLNPCHSVSTLIARWSGVRPAAG